MRFSRRTQSNGAQVDLIPMIDVVFQLILFFLVSTTFAMLPGIELNLPQSSTAEGASSGGITITMEQSGGIYFNETPVDYQSLSEMLASFDDVPADARETYPVRLEADDLVTNGAIVKVFDVLRANGFTQVNLRTSEY
ncbi:MAG: biopolymer transporter ExbD [Treponemataceae bacterium]|nr:biopolymer transporter ExbD [Treponemataceae bacterium]